MFVLIDLYASWVFLCHGKPGVFAFMMSSLVILCVEVDGRWRTRY